MLYTPVADGGRCAAQSKRRAATKGISSRDSSQRDRSLKRRGSHATAGAFGARVESPSTASRECTGPPPPSSQATRGERPAGRPGLTRATRIQTGSGRTGKGSLAPPVRHWPGQCPVSTATQSPKCKLKSLLNRPRPWIGQCTDASGHQFRATLPAKNPAYALSYSA